MPARNDDVDDYDPTAVLGREFVDEPIAACVVFVVLDGAIVAFVFIVVRNALEGHRLVVVGCDGRRPEV